MQFRSFLVGIVWTAMIAIIGFWGHTAAAQQDCSEAQYACTDKAFDRADRCEASCSTSSCLDRCDKRLDDDLDACDEAENRCLAGATDRRGSSATGSTPRKPSLAQGNGCYLGECPEDDAPVSRPPRGSETDSSRPDPTPQPQYTWICQTPVQWCTMNQLGPVGMSCWCSNAFYGYTTGVTIPQQ